MNILNPKVALFFLAFLPQFIDPARGTAWQQILALGSVFFAIALMVDLVYAAASGSIGGWLMRRPTLHRHQGSISGAIYFGLAAIAALHGSRSSASAQ